MYSDYHDKDDLVDRHEGWAIIGILVCSIPIFILGIIAGILL